MIEPLSNIRAVCNEHAPKPDEQLHGLPLSFFLGKYVKRAFKTRDGKNKLEHMWVKVDGIIDGQLTGRLNNDPIWNVGYLFGDQVTFPLSDVEAYME